MNSSGAGTRPTVAAPITLQSDATESRSIAVTAACGVPSGPVKIRAAIDAEPGASGRFSSIASRTPTRSAAAGTFGIGVRTTCMFGPIQATVTSPLGFVLRNFRNASSTEWPWYVPYETTALSRSSTTRTTLPSISTPKLRPRRPRPDGSLKPVGAGAAIAAAASSAAASGVTS
jgi:hypothetical protein